MRFCTYYLMAILLSFSWTNPSNAQEMNTYEFSKPSTTFIERHGAPLVREMISSDIVIKSIIIQNDKYAALSEDEIIALDNKWRSETESDDKSLISATLSNPLSANLTRRQAHSIGLFTEIFVMDAKGLNVGQSNITSDMWQGDEAKFKKTFEQGHGTIFIDEAEFDEKLGIWKAQINMTISDENNSPIGAITAEINASELMRRFAS